MKRKRLGLLILCLAAAVLTGCQGTQSSDPYGLAGKTHSAIIPVEQTAPWTVKWWMPRHEKVLERVAEGNVDLIMVGDSITQSWEDEGKVVWQQYCAPRNAVNMGFSGDRTQHVLWRLGHGEIDGISPKLAVLMIGTNNNETSLHNAGAQNQGNTAEEIADGIKAICAKMRAKLPETKILLLAIFPRAASASLPGRVKNARVSELASVIADGKNIFYLDINDQFLRDNGRLYKDIMPDLLHPNLKGYQIWAEAMEPTVKKLMGEQ